MTALPHPSPELLETRDRFAERVKQRLGKPVLTLLDARDGIRDCFVSTYAGGLLAATKGLNLQAEPKHLEAIAERIFRRRLTAHHVSWEAPTVDALEAVKLEADAELHFDQLPAEMRAVHDQVCSLLLGKVSGLLPHRGDTSVVSTNPATPDPVDQAMRSTIAAFLEQFGEAVLVGETLAGLTARHATLATLLETLGAVNRGGRPTRASSIHPAQAPATPIATAR